MIYIVRHGETDWNVEGRYQGRMDIELNENGINQARKTAEKLNDVNFDMVISSPLKRAYETAKIISNNAFITIDSRLIERSNGELEGKLKSEVLEKINIADPNETRFGIETLSDFRTRVFDFCQYLEEISVDKKVLVVTHVGVSIYMRLYFEGKPENFDYKKFGLKNCEVITYESRSKENERVYKLDTRKY